MAPTSNHPEGFTAYEQSRNQLAAPFQRSFLSPLFLLFLPAKVKLNRTYLLVPH